MKEYKYRIWDKQSSVLGREACEWLRLHPHLQHADVFIVNIDGIDRHIENLNNIRIALDLGIDKTDEEVIQQYIDNVINERDQEPIYVQKNAELKTELSQAKLLLMEEGIL